MENMTGIPADQILGKGNFEYSIPFYGKRRPILIDLVLKYDDSVALHYDTIKREDSKLFSEVFIPHMNGKNGAYLWFTASPLYNSDGIVVGAIESIRDITDRKATEKALRESEQLYRNVVEDQTEFICRFLPDGTHVFVNEAYCSTSIKTGKRSSAITSSPDSFRKTRKRYAPCLPLSRQTTRWFDPAKGYIS